MTLSEKTAHTDRRGEIVGVSTGLFLENGFAGTSMSAIAAACGMTKASLYHHFAGKDELFIACVTDGYRAALRAIEVIVADESSAPPQKLRDAVAALYDTMILSAVGRMSPLIAEVSRSFPKVARSFHDDYIDPQQRLVWSIIEQGQKSGDFRETDQRQLFHILFGPMVMLSLSREMFASFEDLDAQYPVAELRDGHVEVVLQLLAP